MASFTFGAGNLRKLLRLPLYALGAAASLVVPRRRDLWVVGCGIGLGEGAVPFYELARERAATTADGRPRRVVWLASDDRELAAARARGWDAQLKHGRHGFALTLRARVAIVTHGFGDVNRFGTRGATVVQLWHGIPLKRLHLDTPAALKLSPLPDHRLVRAVMARAYRVAGRGISLFPVASELVAGRISSAFGVPLSRLPITGDIRDDVLLRGDADARRATARALVEGVVGDLGGGPVLLYAPTWRDGAPDPAAPDGTGWAAIADWLERNDATLLVRSHPLGVGDYLAGAAASPRVRMLGSDALGDVTPALSAVDVLVTDYSSIAYDHALAGGHAVFLAPDLEQYGKKRGLYEPYRDFSGGDHAIDWTGVLSRLDRLLADPADAERHRRHLVREHVDHLDGHAADRVLATLLRRLGEHVPAGLVGVDARPVARPRVSGLALGLDAAGAPELTVTLVVPASPSGAADPPGTSAAPPRVRLEGARARVDGVVTATADGLVARIPLTLSRWGADHLALPSGDYRLQLLVDGDEPSTRLDVATGVRAGAPYRLEHELEHLAAEPVDGGLRLRVAPPLAADERGRAAQRRLQTAYFRSIFRPEDAVFLESFYGRTVACNPAGVDRALARLRPQTTRYWSVADASVPVPPGAVRVIEGSRAWWRARGAARVLIVNDWLRKRFLRRRHQTVLQTWHGTMIKRLALDRPGRGLRTRLAVRRESDRWDVMLAQNDYSAAVFRRAYAFSGPIWELGYPRNDVLRDGDPAAVRRRIGIPAQARVVLYAPTWRDDRTEIVDYLDLEGFAARLPDDTVLLVRGHSRTLPYGRDLRGDRLVDVTTYPDVADLVLAADILVTDYSSVMFDFAATERPIVFFTPDLAHYSEDLRGFYFDLLAEAPGPVVSTRDELLQLLSGDARAGEFAERRAEWRARYAPNDDGHAGERVVQRLLDEGRLG
ncbi:CDP-glycerol glycerophosphotransferase family protein [Schumannella sp. 10F1B-5-1]|uniref:CDP-glycerol glycerophosphotransferase family protein n=1 Tax=Schumannella sp. 10F1B-5-1 TaxID=2590780 RepID=UPI001131F897|nr:CDP-glycerol glycerophosphotransferase family protein [Schumannella sp. 10F1B-5-1]TPW73171.1 hypothetical protein FJ658_07995 [Schumannella sp. 10F1B-5-1]